MLVHSQRAMLESRAQPRKNLKKIEEGGKCFCFRNLIDLEMLFCLTWLRFPVRDTVGKGETFRGAVSQGQAYEILGDSSRSSFSRDDSRSTAEHESSL